MACYLSTIKMRNRVLDKLALQNADKEENKQRVTENYKRLMKSYFEQKKHIPKENLVDVKYEDLVANPIKEVKKIYAQLDLPDLQSTLPEMQKYLDGKKDYKTNVYTIDEKIIQHVKNNWNFTIDRWGYNPP